MTQFDPLDPSKH